MVESRRPASSLAHHEDICGTWTHGFRHLLRLPGLHDQGVLLELFTHDADVTIDLRDGQAVVHHRVAEPWKVTLVDTGELTQTAVAWRELLPTSTIGLAMTYGDAVSTVDIAPRNRLSSRATHASYASLPSGTREIVCAGS